MKVRISQHFRPAVFDDVIGQDLPVNMLKAGLKFNKISGCYLFFGLRGTGKTSVARIFAKALNCHNKAEGNAFVETPCNHCESCKEINKGSSLSVVELDAASNRGIDDMRKLCQLSMYSISKNYKIIILDEAHMLTREAFNVLLKPIEEPIGNVVFIFITTEQDKIPVSIISRCQLVPFRFVDHNIIVQRLQIILQKLVTKVSVKSEVLSIVARISEGCIRDAESILEQLILVSLMYNRELERQEVMEILGLPCYDLIGQLDRLFLEKDHEKALQQCLMLVNQHVISPHRHEVFLKEIAEYYRQQFCYKYGVISQFSVSEWDQDILSQRNAAFYKEVFSLIHMTSCHVKKSHIGGMLVYVFIIRLFELHNLTKIESSISDFADNNTDNNNLLVSPLFNTKNNVNINEHKDIKPYQAQIDNHVEESIQCNQQDKKTYKYRLFLLEQFFSSVIGKDFNISMEKVD